jgi:gliding motility-associated-like protein
MKKLLLIFLALPIISFSCFSQSQIDSLAGFNEKHERDHIMDHGIDSSQIKLYLNLAKKRYINKKYNLGIYAPPKKTSSKLAFDCAVDNWGFEDGTFGGWYQQGAVEIVTNGVDPYGGFPWVYPNGGNFSAKVSSDLNCCTDGRLDKVLNVPINGETLMSFHFAMSIFNFPHTSNDAAKLWVEFYDAGGNLLTCPKYECYYSTDNGAVGVANLQQTTQPASFYNPAANGDGPSLYPVTYADWNTVTIDLSAYQGQQITAVFRVEWCVPGPDWAYVLLDVSCPINTFEPTNICLNETGQATLCGPDNMSSYTWYNSSGVIVGNNQCLDVNAAGTYSLQAMPDDVECTSASLLTFYFTVASQLPIISSISDYNGFNISCFGENDGWISLNSLGSYTYEWQTSPVQYGSTISNLYAGPIDVVAINNGCPSQSITFSLTQPTQITSNITVDACWSYYTNGTNYENSGVYSYTTTNNLGCDSTTILTLNVFDDAIFVPNTFTPNKTDNINDRFFIHNNLTEFKMWIYNRWGEEIFYTEDGQLGWDGKYKGKICQDGLYVWMIEFVCGEESKIETGHLFLLK